VTTLYPGSERPLNDIQWLYALTQAGATFAAIVGAFFTTKILSISAEKRTLENHIDQLGQEVSRRSKRIEEMQQETAYIEQDWADSRIEQLEDALMAEVDVMRPFSLEDMHGLFEKVARRPPNVQEKKAMEKAYPKFKERIDKKAKAEAAERARESHLRWLRQEADRGDYFALMQLQAEMAGQAWGPMREGKSWSDIFRSKPIHVPDVARLKELTSRLSDQRTELAILEDRQREYARDLKALVYPKYTREGFIALVYLLIATVVLPLSIAPEWEALPGGIDALLFLLFITGLLAMIVYLYAEIRDLMIPATDHHVEPVKE
jgi:hypothetical protein